MPTRSTAAGPPLLLAGAHRSDSGGDAGLAAVARPAPAQRGQLERLAAAAVAARALRERGQQPGVRAGCDEVTEDSQWIHNCRDDGGRSIVDPLLPATTARAAVPAADRTRCGWPLHGAHRASSARRAAAPAGRGRSARGVRERRGNPIQRRAESQPAMQGRTCRRPGAGGGWGASPRRPARAAWPPRLSHCREFCHFDGTPLFIPIETPNAGTGGSMGGAIN